MYNLLDDSAPMTAFDVVDKVVNREEDETLTDVYADAVAEFHKDAGIDVSDNVVSSEYHAVIESVAKDGLTQQNMKAIHNLVLMGDKFNQMKFIHKDYAMQSGGLNAVQIAGIIGAIAAAAALIKYFVWNRIFGEKTSAAASRFDGEIEAIKKEGTEATTEAKALEGDDAEKVTKVVDEAIEASSRGGDNLIEVINGLLEESRGSNASQSQTSAKQGEGGNGKKLQGVFNKLIKLFKRVDDSIKAPTALDVYTLNSPDSFGSTHVLIKTALAAFQAIKTATAGLKQIVGDLDSVTKGFGNNAGEIKLIEVFNATLEKELKTHEALVAKLVNNPEVWKDVETITGLKPENVASVKPLDTADLLDYVRSIIIAAKANKESLASILNESTQPSRVTITAKSIAGKPLPPLANLEEFGKSASVISTISDGLAKYVTELQGVMQRCANAAKSIDAEADTESLARYQDSVKVAKDYVQAFSEIAAMYSRVDAIITASFASHSLLRKASESVEQINNVRSAAKR